MTRTSNEIFYNKKVCENHNICYVLGTWYSPKIHQKQTLKVGSLTLPHQYTNVFPDSKYIDESDIACFKFNVTWVLKEPIKNILVKNYSSIGAKKKHLNLNLLPEMEIKLNIIYIYLQITLPDR